jgi:flagellar basal-body rod protein FlgG
VLLARLDPSVGTLQMTGQPLDVALEGEGYFEVSTDQGPAYTRQGTFRLDAGGRLVTAQGHPVMGTNGEIRLATRTPAIDAAGRITEPDATSGPSVLAPGTAVAQLRVVRMEKGAELRHLGDGLVVTSAEVQPLGEADLQIRQGALENSNVSTLREMVLLMDTTRHFESMQRVVQSYDELLSTSIRKLGDLT